MMEINLRISQQQQQQVQQMQTINGILNYWLDDEICK